MGAKSPAAITMMSLRGSLWHETLLSEASLALWFGIWMVIPRLPPRFLPEIGEVPSFLASFKLDAAEGYLERLWLDRRVGQEAGC